MFIRHTIYHSKFLSSRINANTRFEVHFLKKLRFQEYLLFLPKNYARTGPEQTAIIVLWDCSCSTSFFFAKLSQTYAPHFAPCQVSQNYHLDGNWYRPEQEPYLDWSCSTSFFFAKRSWSTDRLRDYVADLTCSSFSSLSRFINCPGIFMNNIFLKDEEKWINRWFCPWTWNWHSQTMRSYPQLGFCI